MVSLGALVSGGPVLAKNWNTKQENNEKVKANQNKDELNVFDLPTCKENVLTFLFGRHAAQSEPCFINYTYPFGPAGGDTFVGEVRNGSWHNGTYTFGPKSEYAGHKYFGEIKNGKWHGKGVYTYPNGFKESGLWREGVFQGVDTSSNFANMDNSYICMIATNGVSWSKTHRKYVQEAKRRGLTCGVGKTSTSQIASSNSTQSNIPTSTINQSFFANMDNSYICMIATNGVSWSKTHPKYVQEAKRRGLTCGVSKSTQTASATPAPKAKPNVTSAALTAAEKEAERLRLRVAALEAEKAKQQQTISSDTKLPTITIALASSNGPQGTVRGRVSDNTGIAEVRVDGQLVQTDTNGNFSATTYVPEGGVNVSIQAVDLAGLSSSMSVRLDRSASNTVASISFERLNPLGRKVAKNKDALALIIGVDGYKSTPARAIYADSDAKVFTDYASQKLGIPTNRIKTLVNDGAGEREMLLSVKSWLSRASKQGKSDVYVFFAGHGLASDNGEKMYLLPYDGAPELLDDTAILRDRLFSDIASANPKSVTVFLDTCYSGTTRGTDMLIASRPIAIKALEQSIPGNFTVMTAARGDQTAKPLEEAKHGMFSYFLMKGMEGDADANQDNKITAGELHQYVQQNVIQQSSGSQTPELQGDAERVLVRFQ